MYPRVSVSNYNSNKNLHFRGTPERLYHGNIWDYHDALYVWERLKSAKYLDVHSDKTSPYNKKIREQNYSFLDKLTTVFDKSQFITRFCEFTMFPNLKEISKKIDTVFRSCIASISDDLNSRSYGCSPYRIIDAGYDTTCSLGLKKAFPGSDLDKGYIIIEGNHPYYSDETLANEFKGRLWFNLDQRIASLNHPDTFPDVYTRRQIRNMLQNMDLRSQLVIIKEMCKNMSTFWSMITMSVFGIDERIGTIFPDAENSLETDPFKAAQFNRVISSLLSPSEREDAKNFAFFIETVAANLRKYPKGKTDEIFADIKNSIFARKSNVTQNGAWQKRIDDGYMKSKLRHREELERDFYSMDIDTKYDLIKDVIKSASNDQGNRFAKFFSNDDDISKRYQQLLSSLR